MEKETKKQEEKVLEATTTEKKEAKAQELKKRVNKTWEAFGKSKGCFIVNDPKFLL